MKKFMFLLAIIHSTFIFSQEKAETYEAKPLMIVESYQTEKEKEMSATTQMDQSPQISIQDVQIVDPKLESDNEVINSNTSDKKPETSKNTRPFILLESTIISPENPKEEIKTIDKKNKPKD